jgi:hypothetical protein
MATPLTGNTQFLYPNTCIECFSEPSYKKCWAPRLAIQRELPEGMSLDHFPETALLRLLVAFGGGFLIFVVSALIHLLLLLAALSLVIELVGRRRTARTE